jgi:hypothetical protein
MHKAMNEPFEEKEVITSENNHTDHWLEVHWPPSVGHLIPLGSENNNSSYTLDKRYASISLRRFYNIDFSDNQMIDTTSVPAASVPIFAIALHTTTKTL